MAAAIQQRAELQRRIWQIANAVFGKSLMMYAVLSMVGILNNMF